jgi:hypothetical protein
MTGGARGEENFWGEGGGGAAGPLWAQRGRTRGGAAGPAGAAYGGGGKGEGGCG